MIRIYSIENCPYCKELKNYLDKDNIPYEDIDVDLPKHEKEYEKIMEITKSDSVPIFKIGKELFVPEVSFSSIEEAFGLIKRFNT